jgi:hypothetical protein
MKHTDDKQPAGAEAPDRLADAADSEWRRCSRQITVGSAESVVAEARARSLLTAQDAAARRLSAAQAAMWAADRAGDCDRRDAALAAVAAARANFTRKTDAAIEGSRGITRAERARLESLVAQLRRIWTALEVTETASRRPEQQKPPPASRNPVARPDGGGTTIATSGAELTNVQPAAEGQTRSARCGSAAVAAHDTVSIPSQDTAAHTVLHRSPGFPDPQAF